MFKFPVPRRTSGWSAALVAAAVPVVLALPSDALAEGPLDDGPKVHLSAVAKPGAAGVGFSNRIGYTTESVGGFLLLGFDRVGQHSNGTNTTGKTIDIGVGGRFLFAPPGKAKPAPYVYAHANTKRASADLGDSKGQDAAEDVVSDTKRYSLAAGFGGEVAFSQAFSLSVEAGLKHDVMDYEDGDFRQMTIHTSLDTGLALNVYF